MNRLTPSEIRALIPPCFKHRRDLPNPPPPGNHNGASSPFRRWYKYIYDPQTIIDIDDNSFPHDYGYTFARLPGSPLEFMTREDWDDNYYDGFVEMNHPNIARLHYGVLRPTGWVAWERNWELMQGWGFTTFDEYLAHHGLLAS